jgi:hypothetical protein
MNPASPPSPGAAEDLASRLFTNMVMQYASMTFMFLGKAPHPETGETVKDLDAAQMFISQLEMLQTKTKGNLSPQEEAILKQSLMTTRLAFVEAIESGEKASTPEKPVPAPPPSPSPSPESAPSAASEPAPTPGEEDERKKFVKKY